MQGNLLHKHRHTAKQNVRHKKLFTFPECAKLCESYPALTHVARTTNSLLNIHMCADLCAHSQPYSLTYNIQQFKRYETVQGCDAVSVAWRSDGLLPFSPALSARGGGYSIPRLETVQGSDAVSVAWRSDGSLTSAPALCASSVLGL